MNLKLITTTLSLLVMVSAFSARVESEEAQA